MTHNKPTLNPQVDPYEQTAAEEEAEFTRWERTRAIGGWTGPNIKERRGVKNTAPDHTLFCGRKVVPANPEAAGRRNIIELRPATMTRALEAAIGYADQRGWKVFPARMEDGKKWSWMSAKHAPGHENWGQTNVLQQVLQNFTRPKWRLLCGVGIPTGAVNRIFVIEADTIEGHGVDGLKSLEELEAKHGKLPLTLMAESPSGSIHRYYQHPGRGIWVKSTDNEIAPGVDIKGDGGMVVAPPSVRSDGTYKWLNNEPIAKAPDWLIELVGGAAPAACPGSNDPYADTYKPLSEREITAGCEAIRDHLPNPDVSWGEWNTVGMKIFRTVPDMRGLAAFDGYSSRSPKYNAKSPTATIDRWSDYFRSPPTHISKGSFIYLVNEVLGVGWRDRIAEAAQEKFEHEPEPKPSTAEPADLWAQSRVPPLPRGLLPPVIEEYAFAQGELMGADPGGLAMGALTVCAAVIPDRIQIQPKKNQPGWRLSAILWAVLVGDVSVMKTGVYKVCMRPIVRLDKLMRDEFGRKKADYDALGDDERKKTPPPTLQRIWIADVTLESAQDIFKDNDDGMIFARDEISGFFGGMDKYSGNSAAQADRAFWIAAFEGGPHPVDRVKRGSYMIKNLSISLLGGTQPDTARRMFADGVDDGLLQRINPIMQRDMVLGSEEEQASPLSEPYEALVERLFALRCKFDVDVVRFDDEAAVIRRQLEAKHLKLVSTVKTVNRKLASHIAKYNGMFAKLCLLWHIIEHYDDAWPGDIDVDIARRVASFLHDFLLQHAIAFYRNTFGLSDDHDRLSAVAGYILAHKLEHLTNRDIQRSVRSMRQCDRRDIESVFNQLDTFGWVDRVPGRKVTDSPTWIVNPAVHEKFKDYAEWEVDHRQQAQMLMAETISGHEMGPTEIAQHPSGYILSSYPGKLRPPYLQLKLAVPGTVKRRLSESGRIWLTWNTEKQRLDDASNSKLAELPDEIQDWLADAINGEAARSI